MAAMAKALRTSATRITISHPRLTAWASLGSAVRISLRHNPVTVTVAREDPSPSSVALSPVSGPFPRGAHSQEGD